MRKSVIKDVLQTSIFLNIFHPKQELKLLRHKQLLGVDELATETVLMSEKRNEETGGQ